MNLQTYINITVRLIGSRKSSDILEHIFDYIPGEYWIYFENQI